MEEKDERTYYVYVHTNIANGKKYVGVTKRKPKERWGNGSNYKYNEKFYRAIMKYGWKDGFTHEVVASGLSAIEAAKMEQELIKKYDSYKNGYNNSLGGENTSEFRMSEEQRRAQSERMKGKWVGENNSAYGVSPKDRMSEEAYEQWAKDASERMKRVGIERTRKVISLSENVIYNSAVEASEKTGIDLQTLRNLCKGNCITRKFDDNGYNYRFRWYYDDETPMTMDEFTIKIAKKPIICLDTKQLFISPIEASRVMGLGASQISGVCNGRLVSVKGYKFAFYDKYVSGEYKNRVDKRFGGKCKEVICLETHKVYYNSLEAANEFGCSTSEINRVLNNLNLTCKGCHFVDYTDYTNSPDSYVLPTIKQEGVLQFDKFGRFIAEYESCEEASQVLGVNRFNLIKCCDGKVQRLICNNSIWLFKKDYSYDTLYDRVKTYWKQNKSTKCIGQYDSFGVLINLYDSATNAGKAVKCTSCPIAQCCKGVYDTIKGYKWKYVSPMTYLDNNSIEVA